MRLLSIFALLLPPALFAQVTVTELGENGWDAYPAFINASSTSFDFQDMAGTADGGLTISTNGVANIASYEPQGTLLSSFVGATYSWQPGTRNVSLKLELNRTFTFFGMSFQYTAGTLVYDPTSVTAGWNTTLVDEDALWWFTGYKGTTSRYRTLSDWVGYFGSNYATINAIELGVGTSTPTGNYSGSIDSIEYSVASAGTVVTKAVSFAAPIPEPATAALGLGICCLGLALVVRRAKSRR